MFWIMSFMALGFGYISISMFIAAAQSEELEQKYKFRRSAIGTLALTLMGCFYAWHFSQPRDSQPPAPPQASSPQLPPPS